MARSGKTAQEFIQGSFSPIIAILCSPKVENVMSKNNLSLVELLQPFGSMEWEGKLFYQPYTFNFKICIKEQFNISDCKYPDFTWKHFLKRYKK